MDLIGGFDHDDEITGTDGDGRTDPAGSSPPDDPLSPQLREVLDKAVADRWRSHADRIAEQQIEEVLTPELYGELEAAAAAAVRAQLEAQLNPEPEPEPVFSSVTEFVEYALAPSYLRRVKDTPQRKWCPRWFDHIEAVSRLEALWRSWEHLRLDPATGMSVWWRDHADHHMNVLFDPTGPFECCDVAKGHHHIEGPPALATDRRLELVPPDPTPMTEETRRHA